MDKEIFIVDTPPESTAGAYALLVSRGMPFGGSGGTAVFFIDKLIVKSDPSGRATLFEGQLADESVVTAFPVGTAFIIAPRHQVSSYTQMEYRLKEQAEEKEVHEALSAATEKTSEAVAQKAPGNYL